MRLPAQIASPGRAPWPLVAAIFLVALVTLGLQVCFSRLLSVTISYHFAFLIVAIAMLGMAASAERVFLVRTGRVKALAASVAARNAALLVTAGTFGFVISFTNNYAVIAIQFVMAGVTFAFAFYYLGYVIADLIAGYPIDVARLYFFDLIGAGAGCFVAVALLDRTSALNAALFFACTSAAAAACLAYVARARRELLIAGCAVAALASIGTAALFFPGITRLRFAKHEQTGVIWEKWNSHARITVSQPDPTPSRDGRDRMWEAGWGMSKEFQGYVPETLRMELDAHAGTHIIRGGAHVPPERTEFLRWDVTALAYWLREGRIGSAFVVGGGGGRDVLTATRFGAARVVVVELNPAVIEATRDVFRDYSGGLYSMPQVSLVLGNARSVLSQRDERYDLIQMSMIDTWAASMAGQLVLSENTLYTEEAFRLFHARLKEDGILSVSRWYDRQNYGEVARVLSLMRESLRAGGAARPSDQVAVIYSTGFHQMAVATCLMKRAPFTTGEIAMLVDLTKKMSFRVLWPMIEGVTVREQLDVGGVLERDPRVEQDRVFDLTAPTDERPFFFNTRRPVRSWLVAVSERRFGEGSRASGLLLITFLVAAGFCYRFLIRPLRGHENLSVTKLLAKWRAPTLYFLGIGVGFMAVELALIQRFIVFLGHPTYALSVVLSSLLLSTGIGSFLSARLERQLARRVRWPLVMLGVGIALSAFGVPPLLLHVQSWTEPARMALAVLLIAPLGVCMGAIFPTGIRILAANNRQELVPWMWGVNGFGAVMASVVGMMIATTYGYTAVLVFALLAYSATFVATYGLERATLA